MPDNKKNESKQQRNIEQLKTNLREEDIQKILEIAMPLSELHQFVVNNIPYDGYVFGVGKIKYYEFDSKNPYVLIPDTRPITPPIPYRNGEEDNRLIKDPWFWGGVAYGGFSTYKSFKSFDICNSWYWKNAKGIRISTQMLHINPETGKHVKNYKRYWDSYTYAANKAKPFVNTAKNISCAGLIIPIVSTAVKGEINVEDTTDFVFAAVNFIPAVGWVISGLYVVVDTVSVITTGEKISTHTKRGVEKLNDHLFTKWVELNQGIKNWINSMSFGYYFVP